jgi:hypothetical protein
MRTRMWWLQFAVVTLALAVWGTAVWLRVFGTPGRVAGMAVVLTVAALATPRTWREAAKRTEA